MATDYDALVLRAETAANNAAASAEQAAADRQAVEQLTLTINNEQAVSIQNSKEEIRQAIVAKGQECDTSVAFADYADKILSITTEAGGVDTSNDTVTADSMLLGVTAHNAAGVQITGTIATSTPTIDDNLITIPAGHIASDTTLTVDEAATATVLDNTVTINKGYTSKEYVVSVATAGAVVTDRNVVTVPKGWHDGSTVTLVSRSLPNISIAVDSDSGRVTASYTAEEGWHNAGTIDAAETLDVQAAQTYTPGTADITIPAYKFLTGAQTIKGEPNLIAENIPSDMNFFGIQGTREIGTTGEGGSCKFYECSAVIEQSEGGVLVSGITDTNVYADDEINGLYTYGELTDCVATTGYTHEKGKMWIYKHPDYVFWLITQSKQAPDPGTSVAYCRCEANENPWELAYDWTLNAGSGEVVVEQAPPADASWTGYEWVRKEETKTEPDTEAEVTSFVISDSGISGLDGTFNKSSDTYGDKPVYINTSNMYCWYYSNLWIITATVDNLSTVYAHSASTSPECPWDATTWYGTWANENQLTNMVVTADYPTKEVNIVDYEKSSTITEGLAWTSVKPEVGKTYTEDALVEVASLYQVIDESSSSSSSSSSGEVEDSSSSSSSSSDGGGTDTPETTDVVFTVTGSSMVDLNGDWIEESGNGYVKADDSTKKCTMDYGPGFWRFWSTVTDVTLMYETTGISNPWDSNASWYSRGGEYYESSMTITKAGSSESSSSSSSSDSSSTDTPSGNIAFTVTHTNADSVDFTGNYCDTGVQYQNQVAYIHEEDADKTGTTPVRFVLYNDGKWGFYKDPFYYISGGDFASLYFYANSSSNSPIGLTYVDNLGDQGTLNVSSYEGGSTDSSSSSDSSSTETESDVLIVSGAYGEGNDIDGEYTLKDTTATGTNRVWTNGTYDIFYLSDGVDSMPSWILAPASAHQSYDYYIYNSPENITNDDGSSRTWNYQSSACSLKVTKKMSSDEQQSSSSSSSSSSSENAGDTEAVVYPNKLSVAGSTGAGVWIVDGVYTKTDTLNEDKPTYENEYKSNQYIKYSDGYWRIYSYDAVSSEGLYTCYTEGELDLSVTWTGHDAHVSGSVTVAEYTDSDENASDAVFSVTGVESPENLNGTYTLVSGVTSIKGSCRWENGNGGIVSPYQYNGLMWMMWNSSGSEPSNPGGAQFYNIDGGMPWKGEWVSNHGTGPIAVTQGSGSGDGAE